MAIFRIKHLVDKKKSVNVKQTLKNNSAYKIIICFWKDKYLKGQCQKKVFKLQLWGEKIGHHMLVFIVEVFRWPVFDCCLLKGLFYVEKSLPVADVSR